jgi:hypothetical protein
LTTAFIEAIIQAHPPTKITGGIVGILEDFERSFTVLKIIEDPKMGQAVQLSLTVNQTIKGATKGLREAICQKVSSFNFFPNRETDENLTGLLSQKDFLEVLHAYQGYISGIVEQALANTKRDPSLSREADETLSQVENMPFEGINGSPQKRMEHLIRTVKNRESLESLV